MKLTNIKKLVSALIASAMLLSLSACNKESTVSSDTSITETTAGTSSSVTESNIYAYSSLLACLENVETKITKYDWMKMGFDDSNWLFPKENIPCALTDLTGDGIEELLVLEYKDNLSAKLEVYSYNETAKDSSVILTVEDLNMQAEGARGMVIGTTKDGKLVILDCPRNETEYMTCVVYSFDGTELLPTESAVLFISFNDDYSESYINYKVNDNGVSQEEYNAKRDEIINSIDQLLQYAFVCGDQLKAKVSGMTSKAMSYDAMHEYLKGKIN